MLLTLSVNILSYRSHSSCESDSDMSSSFLYPYSFPWSGTGVAEVHQFPQGIIGLAVQELVAAVVLNAQLTGEPQVCAIESEEPRRQLLGALDPVEELHRGQVAVTGVSDDILLVSVGVSVAGDVSDGLAGVLVSVVAELLETNLGGVVGDDLGVPGEHEDRELSIAVFLLRGDVG